MGRCVGVSPHSVVGRCAAPSVSRLLSRLSRCLTVFTCPDCCVVSVFKCVCLLVCVGYYVCGSSAGAVYRVHGLFVSWRILCVGYYGTSAVLCH